ncbi:MAG: 1,4-dihydroxy-2-naphthoate octaprenyltransferase [Bacteroidaceae bacterium]|nr:1,4-dihydroxy-2-naphthoate octaprenyltransferase [Bacteroidaceae bacterium]
MMQKWIEAIRVRTLPVSISGVVAGVACAIIQGEFSLIPALQCLLFATLAQIASNFGNEYYDYKKGVDHKGREGFRRGVTEGDITPQTMRYATFGALSAAAAVGCTMLLYGSWWLIPVGICIALFALAYSAGPYPLSHYGLGDIAVVIFFGIVPVTFTCYLQQGSWEGLYISLPISVSIGLMSANVLIVNNYRDYESDKAVNKRTTVVLFGRKAMGLCYLLSGIIAMAIILPLLYSLSPYSSIIPAIYIILHIISWRKLVTRSGKALNPILGETAKNLFIFTILLLLWAYFFKEQL